jgi:multidrug efflux pump subunit AcrB
MRRRSLALNAVVIADPDVATVGMNGTQTQNNGRMFITLKPSDRRNASAQQIINRLRPKLAQVQGAALFLQPAQDINVGGRPTGTLYQYTLQGSALKKNPATEEGGTSGVIVPCDDLGGAAGTGTTIGRFVPESRC